MDDLSGHRGFCSDRIGRLEMKWAMKMTDHRRHPRPILQAKGNDCWRLHCPARYRYQTDRRWSNCWTPTASSSIRCSTFPLSCCGFGLFFGCFSPQKKKCWFGHNSRHNKKAKIDNQLWTTKIAELSWMIDDQSYQGAREMNTRKSGKVSLVMVMVLVRWMNQSFFLAGFLFGRLPAGLV